MTILDNQEQLVDGGLSNSSATRVLNIVEERGEDSSSEKEKLESTVQRLLQSGKPVGWQGRMNSGKKSDKCIIL